MRKLKNFCCSYRFYLAWACGLTNFKNSEKNGENSLFSAISKCTCNANFDFTESQITLEQKFSSSLIFAKSEFYSEKKCDDVEDVGRSIYFLPPPPPSLPFPFCICVVFPCVLLITIMSMHFSIEKRNRYH